MGVIHETLPLAASVSTPQQALMGIAAATGMAGLAKTVDSACVTIHSGEVGVRMRRGRPLDKNYLFLLDDEQIENAGRYQVYRDPRRYWLIPFIDKVIRVSVADNTETLPEFDIESTDNWQLKVNAAITWFVRPDIDHPVKSIVKVNNEKDNTDKERLNELKQTVTAISAAGLGRILSGRRSDELINVDHTEVEEYTRAECEEELLGYGVALKGVQLKPITRTQPEVLKQGLERSDEPERGVITGAMEADEHGMGKIIPLHNPKDIA